MTIKAGDLVVVVKPTTCCGNSIEMGHIFRVSGVHFASGSCTKCAKYLGAVWYAAREGFNGGFLLPEIKKIPPLDEPEREDRKEELTA